MQNNGGYKMDNINKNTNRNYMSQSFEDGKISKKVELNESMSINASSQDELTRKIHNLGGNES